MTRFTGVPASPEHRASAPAAARPARVTPAFAPAALVCLIALFMMSVGPSALTLGCANERLHGVVVRPKKRAPELSDDAAGGPFHLRARTGQVVVLSFGYTSCPDVCPTTLSRMKELYRRLGEARAGGVSMVFVSVDPERDTEARLREYVSAFDPRILGLRLTGASLSSTLLAYGVTSERHDIPADRYEKHPLEGAYYSIDHTAGYFVIDKAGDLRLRFPPEAPVDEMLSDLLALTTEGRER
jgi:protein SCO1